MDYMLLLYNDEQEWASFSDEARAEIRREYFALADELRAVGKYIAGAPLQPSSTASSVRTRDGETMVIDGPFAESKEQLGGYFLISADSVEEAREWAARIPATRYGTVEVRPVLEIEQEVAAR
jgi:hypothetical protein